MARIRLFTDREIIALGLSAAVFGTHSVEVAGLDAIPGHLAAELFVLDAPPEAFHLVGALRARCGGVPAIVWERVTAFEPALNALGAGVQGVLLDMSNQQEILLCIQTVLDGGISVPASIAQAVVSSRRCQLTRRESQLVNLVSQGKSNKDIAYTLGISVGTVKVYLSRLFDKLEVTDRYELALVGLRQSGSVDVNSRAADRGTSSSSVFVPRTQERWNSGYATVG